MVILSTLMKTILSWDTWSRKICVLLSMTVISFPLHRTKKNMKSLLIALNKLIGYSIRVQAIQPSVLENIEHHEVVCGS